MKLLSTNHKLAKEVEGWVIRGMSLAPADITDPGKSVCPWSTVGCRQCCINTSGMAQIKGEVYQTESPEERHERFMQYQIHRARIFKTLMFLHHRKPFMLQLDKEIYCEKMAAKKRAEMLAVRLNVFSDIKWEKIYNQPIGCNIMEQHPDVQFFDYTKSLDRMHEYIKKTLPRNYYLIFSKSEETPLATVRSLIQKGANVAVVFNEIPRWWDGNRVIEGDLRDHRFLDPPGSIVGLKAKARGKKDTTGFVIR